MLFDFLTGWLELPIERPWARFSAFESGQAMLGIGHEPITYAPGRRTGVPADAGFFAIAFEPEPLDRSLLSWRAARSRTRFRTRSRSPTATSPGRLRSTSLPAPARDGAGGRL